MRLRSFNIPRQFALRSREGFSLPEVLLALLVFAVAVGTILALLLRNLEMVSRLSNEGAAVRLSTALERSLRSEDFETVFDDITSGVSYFCYRYMGVVADGGDGYPAPKPGANVDGVVGEDYLLVPAARASDDSALGDELDALEGPLFLVKLERASGAGLPDASALVATSAVVVAEATFYQVGSVNQTDPDGLDPVYRYTVAVRR